MATARPPARSTACPPDPPLLCSDQIHHFRSPWPSLASHDQPWPAFVVLGQPWRALIIMIFSFFIFYLGVKLNNRSCPPSHGWARLALAGHGQTWHPWPSMTSHDWPWPAMARKMIGWMTGWPCPRNSASNGWNSGHLATHLMGPLRSTSTTQPSAPRMQSNSERMAVGAVNVNTMVPGI